MRRVSDGTPAGPAGPGPDDDRVAGPGRRRAYGGDSGERAEREAADPVRIRCYRHEGIVVANHQRARGLRWLAATWELSSSDGRTLAALAELPDLRPGETAAVPVPLRLPQDGGEVWLTLRVLAGEDRPGLPRGTELCAPRVRLRTAAGTPAPRAPGVALGADRSTAVPSGELPRAARDFPCYTS
ncbi:hypothetical protein GCM10010521_40340 [Streptomyces rameus]|uniref:Beta-galactosidase domain-containing protein n=1 Tax=Streptomyces rameus TaxID=68261 RepID=A0ABP6NIJ6_9ACTN